MTPDTHAAPAAPADRLEALQDVLDYATRNFGADNEAAEVLRARMAELESELAAAIAAADAANANEKPAKSPQQIVQERQNELLSDGLMKSPVLLVGLGVAVAAAMTGFSTLFIGMLAAKWLTF